MKRRRLLIISYVFPPHQGIGGRRWAKFAKYLTREGFDVHVVYAKNPGNVKSVWWNDIEGNKNIFLHEVNSFFPAAFTHPPRHLPDRIIYRFWILVTGLLLKGYIYDRTIFSGRKFIDAATSVIKQFDIKDVVVTGAPFRLVYLVTKAKNMWPSVNILADLRDPWTWEPGGDYQKLPGIALKYEIKREEYVIKHADLISVPTKNMMYYLQERYYQYRDKVVLLPHAWDEDEIVKEEKEKGPIIKLIMFGTLYNGIDEQMTRLALALKEMKGKIQLDIYSDSKKYMNIFFENGAEASVSYFPVMPSALLYKRMKNYCASVIINNESDKDHVSTKFIELAASGTPVIYIASKGKASDFVVNNRLGWHISADELPGIFNYITMKDCLSPQSTLNIKSLTFKNVTKQLIEFINSKKVTKHVDETIPVTG